MFLADGFEEVEALAPLDILRRAGLCVKTVGIGKKEIVGAHGIKVVSDLCECEFDGEADCVFLPGGMPGTLNLDASPIVEDTVLRVAQSGYLVAICAAPRVLGRLGLLDGRRFTCYPGTEALIKNGIFTPDRVVTDGKVITARGMGCAVELGLTLVSIFCGKEKADALRAATISE